MKPTNDPVQDMVRALSAEEYAEWMVKYHGLPEASARTIELNLREAFKWHRLQGRLDRHPSLAVLAELLMLRQSAKALKTPERDADRLAGNAL